MKLSFIVPTIDRDKELQACIDSIEKAQAYAPSIPVEVLVVVQKTKQKKDIRTRHPAISTFFYIDKTGLSAARNFAIEQSKGDYLIFIDDDAYVREDFIDRLAKDVIEYDQISAFCGRIMDPVQNLPFTPFFRNQSVKRLRRFDYQYFMGSAHILSRAVIDRLGCYDERFGVGAKYFGSEESDLFFRMMRANEPVVYLPDLVIFHPLSNISSSRAYNNAYSTGAMLTKACLEDKAYFIVYLTVILRILMKAVIRMLQSLLLKGKYQEKAERYHYGPLLRGTFNGIVGYIRNEK